MEFPGMRKPKMMSYDPLLGCSFLSAVYPNIVQQSNCYGRTQSSQFVCCISPHTIPFIWVATCCSTICRCWAGIPPRTWFCLLCSPHCWTTYNKGTIGRSLNSSRVYYANCNCLSASSSLVRCCICSTYNAICFHTIRVIRASDWQLIVPVIVE